MSRAPEERVIPTTSLRRPRVFIPYFCVFCEIFAESTVSPYLYFMVRGFDGVETEAEAAFYLGLLSTAFYAARCISNPFWGWLSDYVGWRKPFVLNGIFWCLVGFAFFGFSKTLRGV